MMRKILTRTTMALAAGMALCAADAGPRLKDRRVTVTVHRVTQISNMDGDLPWEKDDADFYALVWIDGKQYRTKNFSRDDGRPYWTITGYAGRNIVPVRIRLMDDDGGDEGKDDHIDVNPMPDEKDITFYYNTATGAMIGDRFQSRGRIMLNFTGNGDRDGKKAKIAFTIE